MTYQGAGGLETDQLLSIENLIGTAVLDGLDAGNSTINADDVSIVR